ncbi:transglutaminase family protein [Frigidibacter sp. MR17.24]|uniref:transglutaminase family protein n=1 Tax=Frigidibacter sp. MR17.24 TaxID=3127345 RepID=UPI0030131405
MLYDIDASIAYSYQQPSALGRTVLRLLPASVPGVQRLVAGTLVAEPAADERTDRVDFFGNHVTEIAWRGTGRETRFRVQARVERIARPPELDLSPALAALPAEIRAWHDLCHDAPHHFLGPSDRVRPTPEMTAFAADLVTPEMTVFAAVQALGRALFDEMRFDATATTVDTDPVEAFAARHGVCQDFSHIMIACLRGIGIPAAYVSGYLRTLPPPGQERLAGADAMHAWVRAWCGTDLGWVEFDPTNDLVVAGDHILVAVGRDYSDVAPVKGVLRTAGRQASHHGVDVIPLG